MLGLTVGADDYITKPFNPIEVSARVKSQLRRYMQLGGGSVRPDVIRVGGIELDDKEKRVTLDGEVIEDDFALVSMCNGRYYGGGSTPVPEARMNDGVLHTVLVKNISKLRFARLFPDYSAGNHEKLPKDVVRFSTAKVVRIHSDDGDIVTCLDGECSHSHDVTLRLADKKLNFFGPAGCDPNATAR